MVHLLLLIIYLAFISLGLPDALLGAAWPVMRADLQIGVEFAGVISGIVSVGTIVSSLASDRMTRKFGTGKVTLVSVGLTALALFGFSFSSQFWMLALAAIPYGLGAGGVDAALNNYVALHYASRHMSWLHCMWGIGAAVGPMVMTYALTDGQGWPAGYRIIGILQVVLTFILLMSLRLWRKLPTVEAAESKSLSLKQIVQVPGAKAVMLTFFGYCAIESTTGLWASSFLVLNRGMGKDTAAAWASLFYIGITAGRALNGFLTFKFHDRTLIRAGEVAILLGLSSILLPLGSMSDLVGLILVGVGCAPIYPSIIHSTPAYFGKDKSQAMIGVQMASAYLGTLIMPPIFGVIADRISIGLYPIYLLVLLVLMALMHEKLVKSKPAISANPLG